MPHALLLSALLLASPPATAPQKTHPGGGGAPGGAGVVDREPPRIDFGPLRADQVGLVRSWRITNHGDRSLLLRGTEVTGSGAAAFRVLNPPERAAAGVFGARNAVPPGGSYVLRVAFDPAELGQARAQLRIAASGPLPWGTGPVELEGVGLGPLGDELHVNAGGERYLDTGGGEWAREYGVSGGHEEASNAPVAGTADDALYNTRRQGASFTYSFALPRPGGYAVTLHFAELEHSSDGARVFDVYADGEPVLTNLDLHAVAGAGVAFTRSFVGRAQDDRLDLDFVASTGQATVSAIEIVSMALPEVTPPAIDFGAVGSGESRQETALLVNAGTQATRIDTLGFRFGSSGSSEALTVEVGGQFYAGAASDVTYAADVALAPGASVPVQVTFAPAEERYDVVDLVLGHPGGELVIPISGLGGHEGDPFLHVVMDSPNWVVDHDGDGTEPVSLDGSGSHTHEPGRAIVDYRWSVDGQLVASTPVVTPDLALGHHALELEIEDDGTPARTLADTSAVNVLPTTDVPGVLALYYPTTVGGASALLDAVPSRASFGEVLDTFALAGPATVGGSPYTTNVMVRLVGELHLGTATTLDVVAAGGVDRRLELDGVPVTGPRPLGPGKHGLEARFAVDALGDLPLAVLVRAGGGQTFALPASSLSHDESALVPVLGSMPDRGTTLGGNEIHVTGLGFFPDGQVTVHWGSQDLLASDFTELSATSIRFSSPAAPAGQITVTVETPRGLSNARTFEYDPSGPVPILFANRRTLSGVPQPTAAAWGPDGRLYVTSLDGRLTVIAFADDWSVLSMTTHAGVSMLPNHDTLGIAFDPYDAPSPVRVYVGHGEHFLNGGSSFTGPSPYTGQISVLTGPGFDAPIPVATGLPTSNHDHGVNGMVFDANGDLLVAVGGNTNAGVRHPNAGDLPESPLSAAVLLLETSKPTFDGAVTYVETAGGAPNDDQVFGEAVDVAPGVDVTPYAVGLRNPYGLLLATSGRLYATDNGPNPGFGAASTGATTQVSDPYGPDEILLVEYGGYYGHPNRGRGRTDPRQNVYYTAQGGASIPEFFTQALVTVPSSTDGITEYRADTFGGQMRGDLIVQRWGSYLRRIELSTDGRGVVSVSDVYPWTGGLGVVTGPGGVIIALDYSSSRLPILEPNDQAASGLVVYDVFPWRAPATGGTSFVIGGAGFGTLGDTTVSIGGRAATLTSVSPTRIRGIVPADPDPSTDLLDVVVTVGGQSGTHAKAFRYLPGPGLEPGEWDALPDLPYALGEVSSCVIGGVLYLVGEGSSSTFAYDLVNGVWLPNRAARPYPGHHHGGEVVGGKWYLIGGLSAGSEGRVQIYDPATDSWSLGADMNWAGGSVSTCVINGMIYAAGGIVGTWTVDNCARYNPTTDVWTGRHRMPAGRNHAACASDGSRMYVFGGRTGGNWVGNGFDDLQVFDPATNTWQTSADPASGLAPLPQARGGMGSAVFFRGELYVFGGETANGGGAVAGNVYDRVDVYDPVENTWRLDAPMPHPRHGIDPARHQGSILLPGGGTNAGFSQSRVFDAFSRR